MAKIIDSNIESRTVNISYSIWKNALLGIMLGLVFWVVTALISRLTSSSTIPGDIATILVATLGVILMVRLRMTRPLLVALASAVSLWGMVQITSGLSWYESIAWGVLLYGLSYVLFSWIARYTKVVPVLIVIITIVAIVRITTTL